MSIFSSFQDVTFWYNMTFIELAMEPALELTPHAIRFVLELIIIPLFYYFCNRTTVLSGFVDCVSSLLWALCIWKYHHHHHPPTHPSPKWGELGQRWFRKWLVVFSTQNHYLNLCWINVNFNLRNKLQGNFNQDIKIFHSRKCIWKYRLRNGSHFVQGQIIQ